MENDPNQFLNDARKSFQLASAGASLKEVERYTAIRSRLIR
jgi:hypothetical protein